MRLVTVDTNGQSHLTQLLESEDWFEHAIHVFDGCFTCESDKFLLVDVVLGAQP